MVLKKPVKHPSSPNDNPFFEVFIILATLLLVGTIVLATVGNKDIWQSFYTSLLVLLTHFYHVIDEPLSIQILIIFLILGSYIVAAYIVKWFVEVMVGGD